MLPEQVAVTMVVADALEALGVQYAIGGSFASALHGVMRATMDVDLVADLQQEDVAPFVQALGDAFYADAEMMRGAIARHRSFNLIHLDTMFKVDVFVARPRDWELRISWIVLWTNPDDPQLHDAGYAASTGCWHSMTLLAESPSCHCT